MNTATLGGKPVYDPPEGVTGYNWFWCPCGAGASGYGKFLLSRADYDSLINSGDGTADLALTSDGSPGVTIKVVICGYEPVVTAMGSDRSTDIVSVFVRDRRCRQVGRLRKAFNVQKDGFPGGATLAAADCYASTLHSSALWDWATIISSGSISALSGAHLSFTPAYGPRNLIYDNIPIGRAIDDFAARLYVVVGYDHQTDKFSLEEPGVNAAANTTQANAAANFLIGGQSSNVAPKRLPGKIVVTFPGFETGSDDPYDSSRRLYEKTITNSTGTSDVQEALHVGEYIALRSGSSWTNQTELDTAATQMANRYLAVLKQISGDQEYAGIWPFRPDGKIHGICWISGPSHGPESMRGARTSVHYGDNTPRVAWGYELQRGVQAASNLQIVGIGAGRVMLGSSGSRYVLGGGGASVEILWGFVSGTWSPGTNVIQLTPCLGPDDSTETGDDPLDVYIMPPIDQPAIYFGGQTNQILPYVSAGTDLSSNTVYMLYTPPMPRATAQYQGFYESSSSTSSPNVKFAKLQAQS